MKKAIALALIMSASSAQSSELGFPASALAVFGEKQPRATPTAPDLGIASESPKAARNPDMPATVREASPPETRAQEQRDPAAQNAGASPLRLTRDQELEIRENVIDWRSARVRRPDFPVTVGIAIPRRTHLATFPRRLTAQNPHYRRYKFIVAENRVAVIDPNTYRIVAIIGG